MWGIWPRVASSDRVAGLIDVETGVELIQAGERHVLLVFRFPVEPQGFVTAADGLIPQIDGGLVDPAAVPLFAAPERVAESPETRMGLLSAVAELPVRPTLVADWYYSPADRSVWTRESLRSFVTYSARVNSDAPGAGRDRSSLMEVLFLGAGSDFIMAADPAEDIHAPTLRTIGMGMDAGGGRNGHIEESPEEMGPLYSPGASRKLPAWIAWLFEMPPLVAFGVVTALLLALVKIASWMMPAAAE